MLKYVVFIVNSPIKTFVLSLSLAVFAPLTALAQTVTPGAPTATALAGDGQIMLSWDAPLDNGDSAITGYEVNVRTAGASGTEIVATGCTGLITALSCTVTDLTNGTEYTVTVAARNEAGLGPASTPVSVTPDVLLEMPVDFTVERRINSLMLSWTAPPDGGSTITGYTLTYDPPGGSGCPRSLPASSTGCVLFVFDTDTEYVFTLVANNQRSGQPATARGQPLPQPSAVRDFTATPDQSGNVRLTWNAPDVEHGLIRTGYFVQVDDGFAPETGCENLPADATSCTLTDLVGNLNFSAPVGIRPRYQEGFGDLAEVTVAPLSPPDRVRNLVVTPTIGQLEVSWLPPINDGGSQITGYRVTTEPGLSDDQRSECENLDASARSCILRGLDGREYRTLVVAINTFGDGPRESAVVTSLSQPSPPSALTAVVPSNLLGMIDLSWGPPDMEHGLSRIGYRVTIDDAEANLGECEEVQLSIDATGCSLTGLRNAETYTIEVVARYAEGDGASATTSATTPPGPPNDAPVVEVVPQDGMIMVSWATVAEADEYEITVSPVDLSGSPLTVGALQTSRTITGLSNGIRYTIEVLARNMFGDGPVTQVNAVPRTVPGTPRAFSATPGFGQAQLSWVDPADDGGVDIRYQVSVTVPGVTLSSGEASGCEDEDLDGTARGCVLNGLVDNREYFIELVAVSPAGAGNPATASVTTNVNPVEAPANFQVIPSMTVSGQLDLSWDHPTDEGGQTRLSYVVTVENSDTNAQVDISATGCANLARNEVACVVTGLANNQAYNVKIRGEYLEGPGMETELLGVMTGAGMLTGDLTVTGIRPMDSALIIDWTEVTEADEYVIDVQGLGYRDGPITVEAPETSRTITGLINGNLYTIIVTARNNFGDGPSSIGRSETPRTTPGIPTQVTAVTGPGQIEVRWSPPSDDGGSPITNYDVMLRPVRPDEGSGCTALDGNSRSCVLSGLTNGITYRILVRAGNIAGRGMIARLGGLTPLAPPSAPVVTAVPGGQFGEISLSWTEPDDNGGRAITRYEVSVNGSPVTQGDCVNIIFIPDPTAVQNPNFENRVCTISGIDSLGDQDIEVRARSAIGLGDPGTTRAAANLVPDAPTDFLVERGVEQFTLTWNTEAAQLFAINGFEVTLEPAAPGSSGCTGLDSSASGCTLTGLASDQTYTVRLRALGSAGNNSPNAETQSRPFARPTAPTLVLTSTTAGQIDVTWDVPTVPDGLVVVPTGFQLTAILSGSPVDISTTDCDTLGASARSCSLSGLAGGEYTVEIVATYQGDVISDTGTQTFMLIIIIPIPSVPRSFTADPSTTTTHGFITLSWDAPATNSSDVSGYTVTPPPTGGTCGTLSAAARTCEYLGSSADSQTITLVANSANGPSSAATASSLPHLDLPAPATVSLVPLSDRITVSWTVSSDDGATLGLTGFTVTVAPNEGSTGSCRPDPLDSALRTCTLEGLTAATEYTVTVATRGEGEGNSQLATATTLPLSIPSVPRSFTADPSTTTTHGFITLSWDAPETNSSDVSGYTVTPPPTGGTCGTLSAAARTCEYLGSSADSQTITLVANSANGPSPAATASSLPHLDLPAPATVSLVPLSDRITVSWTVSSDDGATLGLTGFTVTVAPNNGSTGSCRPDPLDSALRTCTLEGLTAGTEYTVTVATRGAGEGNSRLATVTTLPLSVPSVPRSFTADPSTTHGFITLSWDAPATNSSDVSGYTASPTPTGGTCGTLSATARTCEYLANSADSQTITLVADSDNGPSPAATDSSLPHLDLPAPATVSLVPLSDRITVSWTVSSDDGATLGLTGFTVTVAPNNGSTGSCRPDPLNAALRTCTLEGLTAETAYTVTVATRGAGEGNSRLATATTLPLSVPSVPRSFTAAPSTTMHGFITLSWDAPATNSSDVSGYTVTPTPTGGTCGTLSAAARTCEYLANSADSQTITLVANSGNGPSPAATASSLPHLDLPAPATVSLVPLSDRITVSWTVSSDDGATLGLTGFTVTVAPNNGSTGSCRPDPLDAALRTCTLEGLTAETAYTVTVATRGAGEGNSRPATATTLPLSIPSVPRSFTAASSTTTTHGFITLSWDAPATNSSDVSGYTVTPPPTGGTCGTLSAAASSCEYLANSAGSQTITLVADSDNGPSPAATASSLPHLDLPAPATVSLVPLSDRITVSWTVSSGDGATLGLTGFTVTVAPDDGSTGSCRPDPLDAALRTCTLEGLTAATEYTVTVATRGAGEGNSRLATATTLPLPIPSVPRSFTAAPSTTMHGFITLRWDAPATNSSDVSGYTASPTPTGGTCGTLSAAARTCEYLGNSVGSQTIMLVANSGNGPSPAATASSPPHLDLPAPATVSLVPLSDRITVSWTVSLDEGATLGLTGFTVTVAPDDGSTGSCRTSTLDDALRTCTLEGLNDGTEYTVTVATTGSGAGNSEQAVASTRVIPELRVTSAVYNHVTDTVDVTAMLVNPSNYFIQQSQAQILNPDNTIDIFCTNVMNARCPQVSNRGDATQTFSISASMLLINTVYRVRGGIRATIFSEGFEDLGQIVASTTLPVSVFDAPGAPASLSLDGTASTLANARAVLSWEPGNNGGHPSPVSDFTYEVTPPCVTDHQFDSGTNTWSCQVMALSTAEQSFEVRAVNPDGQRGAAAMVSGLVRQAPGAPVNVVLEPRVTEIVVNWELSPDPLIAFGVSEFSIAVSPDDGSGCRTAVAANERTCTLTGLTAGVEYTVTVSSVGNEATTAAAPVRTTPSNPGGPTSLAARPVTGTGGRQVVLTWAPPANEFGQTRSSYMVTSNPPAVSGCSGLTAQSTSCELELVADTVYQISIMAQYAGGVVSAMSTVPYTTTALTPPSVPRDVRVRAADMALVVSWTAPQDTNDETITSYTVRIDPANADSQSEFTGITAMTYRVEGLDNDVEYQVDVLAITAGGTGDYSAAATGTPGTAIVEAATGYLSDVGQILASQVGSAVSEHLSAPPSAGLSYVSAGGRTLSIDDMVDTAAATPEQWRGHETLEEILKRGPLSFGLNGGDGLVQGSYTLWGRVGIQGFEGKTQVSGDEYDGDVLSSTLGVDYNIEDGLVGLGVTYSTGDGSVGDNEIDLSMVTVHPYLRWDVSPDTQLWGQFGLGSGNIEVRDNQGNVDLDEDFKLGFVSAGGVSKLSMQYIAGVDLAIKTDAQAVQIDGTNNRELDSESWRLRTAVEASGEHELQNGGVLQPTAEIGVRYDGGDTQTGLGLDASLGMRVDDARRGLVIEGNGRYLLVHRESSKKRWDVGALVSFDIGAKGLGLHFSLEPSYGTGLSGESQIWRDRISEVSGSVTNALRMNSTLGYGVGALGGRAVATPYGRYEFSNTTRKLREGLRLDISSDSLHVDLYAEQSFAAGKRRDNSINIRFGLDF